MGALFDLALSSGTLILSLGTQVLAAAGDVGFWDCEIHSMEGVFVCIVAGFSPLLCPLWF